MLYRYIFKQVPTTIIYVSNRFIVCDIKQTAVCNSALCFLASRVRSLEQSGRSRFIALRCSWKLQSTSLLIPHSQQNLAVSGNLEPHSWQNLDILHLGIGVAASPSRRLFLEESSSKRPGTSLVLRPWCEYLRFKLGGRN